MPAADIRLPQHTTCAMTGSSKGRWVTDRPETERIGRGSGRGLGHPADDKDYFGVVPGPVKRSPELAEGIVGGASVFTRTPAVMLGGFLWPSLSSRAPAIAGRI